MAKTKDVGELRVTLRLLKDKFVAGMNEATDAVQKNKELMEKASTGMLVFGGALVAAGGFAIKKAADFEFLRTRMQALFNDTARGSEEFDKFVAVASRVPFTLESVAKAGATLAAFLGDAKDKTSELLPAMADLAAFMGEDVPLAAASFGRAFAGGAGAADMLRDRGVLALVALKGGFADAKAMTKAFEKDLTGFRNLLIETLTDPNLGIAGASGRLAKTLQGQLSMLKDATDILAASIGDTLLPNVTEAVRQVTQLARGVNELPDWLKKSALQSTFAAGGFSLLAGGALKAAGSFSQVLLGLKLMNASIPAALGLFGKLSVVLAGIAAILLILNARYNKFVEETDRAAEAAQKLNDSETRLRHNLEQVEKRLTQLESLEEKYNAELKLNLISQEEYNDKMLLLRARMNAVSSAGEKYSRLLGKLKVETDEVKESTKELSAEMKKLAELDFEAEFERWRSDTRWKPIRDMLVPPKEEMPEGPWKESLEQVKSFAETTKELLVDNIANVFSDILVDAITDFGNAFENMGQRMLRMIASIVGELLRMRLTMALGQALGIGSGTAPSGGTPTIPEFGGVGMPGSPTPPRFGGGGGYGQLPPTPAPVPVNVNVVLQGDAEGMFRVIQQNRAGFNRFAENVYLTGGQMAATR